MFVYVASSYSNAAFVREVVHPKLVEIGITPTSRWAEQAVGPEDFSRMTVEALQRAAKDNDRDLRASDACFVLDEAHQGKETYCEARTACEWGKAIVWLGRPMLSMWRHGVVRVDSITAAFVALTRMKRAHVDGARGHLLAHAAVTAIEGEVLR